MSLKDCPRCWDGPENCRCTEEQMEAYHKDVARRKKELEDYNASHPKDPLWEAVWESYKSASKENKV